ncbi:MAG: hypothetical protein ACI4UE_04410 [Candidatus Scatovivens sp.]
MAEERELMLERKKLKEIITKLAKEENNIEDSLYKNSFNHQKDEDIRANLEYICHKKIVDIRNIKSKPYFARLDFKEDNHEKTESIYIGKISIIDSQTKEPLIIDWRAPISNLYYEGKIGKATYNTIEKEISRRNTFKKTIFY